MIPDWKMELVREKINHEVWRGEWEEPEPYDEIESEDDEDEEQ